jgi:hypothetical protein
MEFCMRLELFADYFPALPHNNLQEFYLQSSPPRLTAKMPPAEVEMTPNSLSWNILHGTPLF